MPPKKKSTCFQDKRRRKFNASLELGEFIGKPYVRWTGPDEFEFAQIEGEIFSYKRANGEVITPDHFDTTGGSIPRALWSIPGCSPWEYGPAFLIHDWEFLQHQRGESDKSFEEVNRTLAEGIMTLMKTKVCVYRPKTLYNIYLAVSSPIGKRIWNKKA